MSGDGASGLSGPWSKAVGYKYSTAEENAMDDEDRQRYEDTTLACGFAAAALVLCLVASVGGAWAVVRALIGVFE